MRAHAPNGTTHIDSVMDFLKLNESNLKCTECGASNPSIAKQPILTLWPKETAKEKTTAKKKKTAKKKRIAKKKSQSP